MCRDWNTPSDAVNTGSRLVWQFLKHPPAYNPTSLGIYSGEMEAHAHTQTWTALFATAKSEITQISINRWLNKQLIMYPYNGILSNRE